MVGGSTKPQHPFARDSPSHSLRQQSVVFSRLCVVLRYGPKKNVRFQAKLVWDRDGVEGKHDAREGSLEGDALVRPPAYRNFSRSAARRR